MTTIRSNMAPTNTSVKSTKYAPPPAGYVSNMPYRPTDVEPSTAQASSMPYRPTDVADEPNLADRQYRPTGTAQAQPSAGVIRTATGAQTMQAPQAMRTATAPQPVQSAPRMTGPNVVGVGGVGSDGTIDQVQSYDAQQLGQANQWKVDANQTVAGQLGQITADNSPIIQMARHRALEEANARGLMNSSIAVGAAQGAAYDAAMPIATADATQYGKAAAYNADIANQFLVENTRSTNDARRFGADSSNKAQIQNSGNRANILIGRERNDTDLTVGRERNQTTLDSTQMQTDTQRYGYDTQAATAREGHQVERYGIDTRATVDREGHVTQRYGYDTQANTARYGYDLEAAVNREGHQVTREGNELQANTARYGYDTQASTSRYNTDVQASTSRYNTDVQASTAREGHQVTREGHQVTRDGNVLDAQTRQNIAQLNATTQVQVANLQGEWQSTIQTNSNAATLFNTSVQLMRDVEMDPNIDGPNKAIVLNRIDNYTRAAMAGIRDWDASGASMPSWLDGGGAPGTSQTAPPQSGVVPPGGAPSGVVSSQQGADPTEGLPQWMLDYQNR